MKIRWLTYWFRLQNTTLFFYTKKNGSASHLRGNYYIYTVQSVREVQRADSSRFMFEIIMKNGKRKMLAAETAALRKEWVGQLWQAMHLSASRISMQCSDADLEECEQPDRQSSSTSVCSYSDGVMESPPARPLSAPSPSTHTHRETRSVPSALSPRLPLYQELNSEEAVYENTLLALDYRHQNGDRLQDPPWSCGWSRAQDTQEGDYDVLPPRNKVCKIDISTQMDEGVYDTPLSYRMSTGTQDPAEGIYDLPRSLLRATPDRTTDGPHEEGACWTI
ncbi:uncharacterized protein LOC118288410 isoform X2 [Scophthalmus maximus]|nr:uncharacterized protein LOC118288410 isoform X2 [Scophthalmus maximus]